jgi:hypothetical protein
MMVPMAVAVLVCVLRNRVCWVEASDRKQYSQWYITPCGLDDPYPVYVMVNPLLDHLDMFQTDKIYLVKYH